MPKSTDIRIKHVESLTEQIDYRTPIKFGGRVVVDVVILSVKMEVETRDGRRGEGFGSMPIGNVWAWPSQVVGGDDSEATMTSLGQRMATVAGDFEEFAHPLEITHAVSERYSELADDTIAQAGLPEPMPKLAQLVAASPWEAAVYDAYGKTLGENSFNLLSSDFANEDLAAYLTPEFNNEFLDQYTSRRPQPRLPLYHLVGALDPLTHSDVESPVGDGLPETLGEWIHADGLTHFKIKLSGEDLAWDVDRVTAVDRVAEEAQGQRGCEQWFYSLDFNEKCANVEYVLEFLRRVTDQAERAMQRVQYIEQPTHRDLRSNPENRMHEAAKIKPVVIDESLTDFESLQLAREQGYSGVALKACKGHSEAMLMGAAAQKYGLFLCVQDLTCVGASFLHSASLSARIPTVAAIEGNGRQYCPAGNAGWSERFPGMFNITDGTVATAELSGPGLGF